MSKPRAQRAHYSMDFKLQLLKEYYESSSSIYSISKRYNVDNATFNRRVRFYESKGLSLPQELTELENQVYMARKKFIKSVPLPMSELDRLRDENERFRKSLSYSELRNEALNEVLKTGREQYGIDLLKKAGAKQ